MRHSLSLAVVLVALVLPTARARSDTDYSRYLLKPPDPAQVEREREQAAARESRSKAACYWLEGAAKVLFFLSFWYVSKEIIELERWRRFQELGSKVLGGAIGILIFLVIVRSGIQTAHEVSAKLDQIRATTSGISPSGLLPPPAPKNPVEQVVSAVMSLVFSLLPIGIMVFMGYVCGFLGGVAGYALTMLLLGGWNDFPRKEIRLAIGASAFMLGAILDIAAWFFRPG
ncbi:MAG: hypothetical protein JWN86_3763 [Planctomycetota bacterium]|nr:hypothetical protein [Planctomycetota bacterium]